MSEGRKAENDLLDELRSYFGGDHFAVKQGITIESAGSEGAAVCKVEIRGDHKNSQGAVQGGLIFTLADFCFAVAANARSRGTVTLDAHINYLHAAHGPALTAKASFIDGSKRVCVYLVEVFDAAGRLVATMNATGYTKTHYADRTAEAGKAGGR